MSFINILDSQSKFYQDQLESLLSTAVDKEDAYHVQSMVFKDFFNNAYVSSIYKEENSKLSRSYFEDIAKRCILDINILFQEGKLVSDEIAEQFNISKDHRTRARNRTEYLLGLISNLNIINKIETEKSTSFYDSLSNYNLIDDNMIIGNKAILSTTEGLAHLATRMSTTLNASGVTVNFDGNGTIGNYGSITPLTNPISGYTHKYLSDIDSHSTINAIFDGQNNTWFEYQRIGSSSIPDLVRSDEAIWNSSSAISEELVLRIRVDLGSAGYYNWIDLSQYIPDDSRNGIIVNRLNTSTDGINWTPLYPDKEEINQRIYAVPQIFDISESIAADKAISQGTFIFSRRSFRYVELIITNDSSYNKESSLGYMEYLATAKVFNQDTRSYIESTKQISQKELPAEVLIAPQGSYEYEISGSLFGQPNESITATITKRLVPVSGWRYAIGIRDITFSDREYVSSSILVTQLFKTESPIEKIALYTSEIIPSEFNEYGVENQNSWIRYYFSIDEKTWYPISPLHHNAVGDGEIDPKFYSFNRHISDEIKNTFVNQEFIDTVTPVQQIRLKIEFNRPADLRYLTPILQAYTLKCYLEE